MNDFPIPEILVDSIRDDIKSAKWEIEGEKVSLLQLNILLDTFLSVYSFFISN